MLVQVPCPPDGTRWLCTHPKAAVLWPAHREALYSVLSHSSSQRPERQVPVHSLLTPLSALMTFKISLLYCERPRGLLLITPLPKHQISGSTLFPLALTPWSLDFPPLLSSEQRRGHYLHHTHLCMVMKGCISPACDAF